MQAPMPSHITDLSHGLLDLEVASAESLLDLHSSLIRRIRLCFGVDAETFEQQALLLIRRYADYVLTLPSTAKDHYSRPSGLFQLGLEVAFFSLQGVDGHIFSGRATITVRRHLEPRWRLATFIGGLCAELGSPSSKVELLDPHGEVWPSIIQPLRSWMAGRPPGRIRLRWKDPPADPLGLGLLALPHVATPDLLSYLGEGNSEILPSLLANVAGVSTLTLDDPLGNLVRRAYTLVVDRDLQAQRWRASGGRDTPHVMRFVVHAMRHLVRNDPHWSANRPKSRLWFASDGLYLVWPQGASDVVTWLENEQLSGMPRSADALLAALLDTGAVDGPPENAVLSINVPGTSRPVDAVRLTSAAIAYGSAADYPAPLECDLAAAPHLEQSEPSAHSQGQNVEAPAAKPDESHHAEDRIALRLPHRLNRTLRDALADIMRSPQVSTASADLRPGEPVFIPLDAFQSRQFQPQFAIRALAQAGMLETDLAGSPLTVTRTTAGVACVGVLISAEFIERSGA